MAEITPLPWKVTPFGEIYSEVSGDFVWVATDTDEADGQFIVRVVNSYPALLAAARAVVENWEKPTPIEPLIDALRAAANTPRAHQ